MSRTYDVKDSAGDDHKISADSVVVANGHVTFHDGGTRAATATGAAFNVVASFYRPITVIEQ